LLVAGHTHGGQVQIPFFGPPITLSRVPRSVAAGGFHSLDGRAIYVSRGIGNERGWAPRVRFLAPPEVSLLTLESAARHP
jgi:predicted MPP superfamily phosphohydrolase